MPLPDPSQEPGWDVFRAELARATSANARHPLTSSWASPRDAMVWMRQHLPYRFSPALPVASLWTAVPRGYGACAEAASALAAWAHVHGRNVRYCLERRPDLDPRYAHVVAVVDGAPFDVFAEAARPSTGCDFSWSA